MRAKVNAVNGDQYTISIEYINGTKVADGGGDDDDEYMDDGAAQPETGEPITKDGAALLAKAAAADKRAGRV